MQDKKNGVGGGEICAEPIGQGDIVVTLSYIVYAFQSQKCTLPAVQF